MALLACCMLTSNATECLYSRTAIPRVKIQYSYKAHTSGFVFQCRIIDKMDIYFFGSKFIYFFSKFSVFHHKNVFLLANLSSVTK